MSKIECPKCGRIFVADDYISDSDMYDCTNDECRVRITVDLSYEEPSDEETEEETEEKLEEEE